MTATNITNAEEAAKAGWEAVQGDLGDWECVSKARNTRDNSFKSTKRMKVDGGYLYQVTTSHPDRGNAEALCFVPFDADQMQARILSIVGKPISELINRNIEDAINTHTAAAVKDTLLENQTASSPSFQPEPLSEETDPTTPLGPIVGPEDAPPPVPTEEPV